MSPSTMQNASSFTHNMSIETSDNRSSTYYYRPYSPFNRTETMGHRQPRTYSFLGLFLANLLTNVVLAKLAPLSAGPYSYDVDPWLAYNRPTHEGYYQQNSYPASAYWNPIPGPYTHGPPPLHTTVSFTTPIPVSQQQIVSPNSYLPDYYSDYVQDTAEGNEEPQSKLNIHEDFYQDNILAASNKSFTVIEPVASGTTLNDKRQIPDKSTTKSHVKRATYGPKYSNRPSQNRLVRVRYKRYKTGQQRKRFTTTPSYYDDSYEDFTTTRYRPRKTYRPTYGYRKTTTQIYDDYEEESFEATTRPYRRRKPTRIKNKRRPAYEDDNNNYDTSYEYDEREPITETVTFRQRQASSTTTDPTTTETTTTTPTTETTNTTAIPANATTNGTTLYPGQSRDNVSITITRPGSDYLYPTFTGYGPSNGNENISITYGPPTRLEYAAPFVNWYAPQPRPNELIGRVQDIVGFDDRDAFRRRLT